MQLTRVLFFFSIIHFFSQSSFAAEDFSRYVELRSEKRNQEAYEKLLALKDTKLKNGQLANKYLALGITALDFKQFQLGREHLEKALALKHENKAHIYYLIGHSFNEERSYDEAIKYFNLVQQSSPPQNIAYLTRFELSEIALATNRHGRASEHLLYLERRWRGTPRYPEVVWRLMEVEFNRNHRTQACRWARKLYSGHPGHPLVSNWGYDLRKNKYNGGEVGCLASLVDHKKRIRNLQLTGNAQKARSEIEQIRQESFGGQKYDADMLLVGFLESTGFPDEALQILIPYHATHEENFNYQSLLAKVAARAGEYPTAIGAYYRAYRLSPRSKSGREALFSAAFLSYQTQDYDGATRRFSELIGKYPDSGLARDSKWHLAWLTYLRGNYSGSERKFTDLLNERVRVRRKRWTQPYNNDRTKYWLAMSLVRQEKFERARVLLEEIAKDPYYGFYAIVSANRLLKLPQLSEFRGLAAIPATQGEQTHVPVEVAQLASPATLFGMSGEKEKTTEESESEEDLQPGVTEADTDVATTTEEAPKDELLAVEEEHTLIDPLLQEEKIQVTSFRDPKLQSKFVRAQNLIAIGENEWAKWELYDIESRTRNKPYLKNLMELYTRIGSFHRAAYIAETYFSTERARGGLNTARDVWSFNFPRAFPESVKAASKSFNVPEAIVLSIIKAESSYHPEAVSPVGARGLMQIMPYTAEQLTRLLGEESVQDGQLLEPATNIRLGTRYLSRLLKKFQDQVPLAAAAYNAGPHRVYSWLRNFGNMDMDEFIEHVPFVETRNYMKKVARNYALYNYLYNTKNVSLDFLTKPVPVRVSERPSPRENWESIE